MTKALFAALAIVCAAAAAQAEVYRWTDAHGVTHYTSDINQVPASQRDLARRSVPYGRGSLQRIGASEQSDASAPAAPVRSGAAASPSSTTAAKAAPASPGASGSEESFDGKSEAQWRDEAAKARDRLTRAEASAEHCKNDTYRASSRASRKKIEEGQSELAGCERIAAEAESARQALDAFEERAHAAGVPPGWIRE
jgi:hypothetical protein